MAKRVLVVDDDLPTVKLIQTALKGEGLEVLTAANGAECLLKVYSDRPDLVILDVAMPVLDGFETLRLLRQAPENAHLPVIMLTARGEQQDLARGLAGRADIYLTKPFDVDALLLATRRILEATAGPSGDTG